MMLESNFGYISKLVQHQSKTNPCSQVVEGEEYKPFGFYSRSVLRINVTETVNYTCYAINQMMGGRQSSDQKSFMVYVESTEGKKTFYGNKTNLTDSNENSIEKNFFET